MTEALIHLLNKFRRNIREIKIRSSFFFFYHKLLSRISKHLGVYPTVQPIEESTVILWTPAEVMGLQGQRQWVSHLQHSKHELHVSSVWLPDPNCFKCSTVDPSVHFCVCGLCCSRVDWAQGTSHFVACSEHSGLSRRGHHLKTRGCSWHTQLGRWPAFEVT